MIAKLRVGCTVAGCAPAVRTIVRRVLFHWITSSTDPMEQDPSNDRSKGLVPLDYLIDRPGRGVGVRSAAYERGCAHECEQGPEPQHRFLLPVRFFQCVIQWNK